MERSVAGMKVTDPELVSSLSFPTSVAFDANGLASVAESGLPFGGASPGGRVWRIDAGRPALLTEGLRPPVNGLTFHDDFLYVSEGGHPARISRLSLDGERTTIARSTSWTSVNLRWMPVGVHWRAPRAGRCGDPIAGLSHWHAWPRGLHTAPTPHHQLAFRRLCPLPLWLDRAQGGDRRAVAHALAGGSALARSPP